MERRLSKKDLMELYGVDRVTIEDWRRNRGLKMIEVSTHSKYISEKDLLEWENSLKGNYSVKRLNNQTVSEWIGMKGWYTFFKSSELISISVLTGWGFLWLKKYFSPKLQSEWFIYRSQFFLSFRIFIWRLIFRIGTLWVNYH